jgi:ABC-type antimicrobial peptide transport system permease subunit
MKASMYLNYTSRSLVRGGQRTLLAIFCVAVGVMAIVALQLVGLMINNAFTSNVRDANGGDVTATSQNAPFTQDDLSYFDTLKKQGTIVQYTPSINGQGTISVSNSLRESFTVRAVNPMTYPVVTPPTFTTPKNGTISDLLKDGQVIATQPFIDQYKKKIGDTFDIHLGAQQQSGRTLHVKLVGIVTETGVLTQAGSLVLLSVNDYKAVAPKADVLYDTINVSTKNSAQIDQVVKDIQGKFPIATTQTPASVLQTQQASIDNIKNFLEISGLLALLIGGIGIVNTMQVLLSRRKTEIAMLKTTGYKRYDLYLLFGLEASLLGLIGGIVGAAAATGVSYLVRALVQQTFGLTIPFVLDPVTIGGGVVIGLVTALIFGLLPLVQAANIRPLNVIRDMPEGRGTANFFVTLGLLLLLSALFCALAIFILNNNVVLGLISVYGTFAFLGILSLFFALVVFIIGKLPVPERLNLGYVALIMIGLAVAALLYRFSVTFSVLLGIVSLLGLVVVFLPRPWKATTKMALRNLDRQRARTTTTLIALFVGVFTVGLILVLGQDLRETINNTLANTLNYNIISITSGKDTTAIQNKLKDLPGLSAYQHRILASTAPVQINGQPIQNLLPKDDTSTSSSNLGRGGTLYFLSGIEGYDVGNNQIPSTQNLTIEHGRNLRSSDAGTNNVVIPLQLADRAPLHLKVGNTITFVSVDRRSTATVTVVGVYQSKNFGSNLYPILGTNDTVKALTPTGFEQSVFYMKIDPNKVSKAVDILGNAALNAFVLNLANIGDIVGQFLNDILLTLTTIASLSLLAGIIIIANAVALAMLERRRELGILKSVGYTSGSILSEVLTENALVGGTGALLAVLLVTLATSILGTFVFKTAFGVNSYISLALIAGSALLAMITAALVAWGSVRMRPLEVLRYE